MDIIKSIEHEQLKNKVPVLTVGNTVKVYVKIKEGNRERIQVFEGIIIKKQGGGVNESVTVRKISYGVGVEKTFLVHSPMVEKVEVVRVGKARRARLFYLRDRVGKASKTKEKIGARIEDKEIVLKEDMAEDIASPEEAPAIETTETTTELTTEIENAGSAAGIMNNEVTCTINITKGMSSRTVCDMLKQNGIIEDAADFDRYLIKTGYDDKIRVGEVEVNSGMTYEELTALLYKK